MALRCVGVLLRQSRARLITGSKKRRRHTEHGGSTEQRGVLYVSMIIYLQTRGSYVVTIYL